MLKAAFKAVKNTAARERGETELAGCYLMLG